MGLEKTRDEVAEETVIGTWAGDSQEWMTSPCQAGSDGHGGRRLGGQDLEFSLRPVTWD